jgi:hypothetical protein
MVVESGCRDRWRCKSPTVRDTVYERPGLDQLRSPIAPPAHGANRYRTFSLTPTPTWNSRSRVLIDPSRHEGVTVIHTIKRRRLLISRRREAREPHCRRTADHVLETMYRRIDANLTDR